MTKLSKLAAGVALAVASSAAFAGTLTVTSQAVGVEASTTGSFTATADAGKIVLTHVNDVSQDQRVFVELDNGATFADSSYTLWVSNGAGSGNNNEFVLITPSPAGKSKLEFRAASGITVGDFFILSSSNAVNATIPVNVKVPAAAAGTKVSISGYAQDTLGPFDYFTATELFRYANQFSATTDTLADAIVDVNDSRLTFTGGAKSDVIALDFFNTGIGNGVSLNDDDKVEIELSGDMSTIQSIALATGSESRGNFTIDAANGKATFSASASDVFAAGSASLTANVWGSAALATRSFTVKTDLNFDAETDKNLIAESTNAGQWGINGLQAKVSHLSLNSTGFISWLKVVNEGSIDAEISADIIYTLADGTEGSVSSATLGTVDAGGVFTVSEASILNAIGNPAGLVDASMTVTVAGQVNLVHLVAEKKASDGRVNIPVYYNTTGANPRNWVQ